MHPRKENNILPVVRALNQFGPMPKNPSSVRLFLDDARNPPLNEQGWIIVRNVAQGIWFMYDHGHLVTEVSLDNDLGHDPEGYKLLEWILAAHAWKPFPQLKQITIHTGNLLKWRKMREMLRGSPLTVKRRVPTNRIYPKATNDTRDIIPYVKR